jgi:diacylglycerol kinase (ATP)
LNPQGGKKLTPNISETLSSDALKPIQASLIFNPSAGWHISTPDLLQMIVLEMQSIKIVPEVFVAQPGIDLEEVARDAIRRGISTIIVSGGDGTIDSVMRALVATPAVLGIIPSGTQNNTARSLGIPLDDLSQAVRILRFGRKLKVDVGLAHCNNQRQWFLETASVGLMSALYPAADGIQHGELGKIGDFLATLIRSKPARMHMILDHGHQEFDTLAHLVLVSNMPYIGKQFQPASDISFDDSLLDLFVYANLNKLELIEYAVEATSRIHEDPRILHFRVSNAMIESDPKMPVMVDGMILGEDTLHVSRQRQALSVMAGEAASSNLIARSEAIIKENHEE